MRRGQFNLLTLLETSFQSVLRDATGSALLHGTKTLFFTFCLLIMKNVLIYPCCYLQRVICFIFSRHNNMRYTRPYAIRHEKNKYKGGVITFNNINAARHKTTTRSTTQRNTTRKPGTRCKTRRTPQRAPMTNLRPQRKTSVFFDMQSVQNDRK